MNKNILINLVLGLAVLVLYILHFTGGTATSSLTEEDLVSDTSNAEIVGLDDTVALDISKAASSKLAYFNVEELGNSCPYLKRKMDALIKKEEALYASAENKEKELGKWYDNKQRELAEYEKKKMLVPALVEQAQMDFAKKQQEMQAEFQREERALLKAKEDYLIERADIINAAVKQLNVKAGWDYVLVDNPEIRIVIPFNEKSNITKNLAIIINKKYK